MTRAGILKRAAVGDLVHIWWRDIANYTNANRKRAKCLRAQNWGLLVHVDQGEMRLQYGLYEGDKKKNGDYGAFPVDPYSHTPGFTGVQQPGLTGQVKEDVITRFWQLGVRVERGEVAFEPVLLGREEFLKEPASWSCTTGGLELTEELPAGSLAFTLCGIPVIYRLAGSSRLQVFAKEGAPTVIHGNRLGLALSQLLFRREQRIRKLVVDVPEATLG